MRVTAAPAQPGPVASRDYRTPFGGLPPIEAGPPYPRVNLHVETGGTSRTCYGLV